MRLRSLALLIALSCNLVAVAGPVTAAETNAGPNGIPNGIPSAATLDRLARCIQASGATFYGAHWCPHCQAQHHLFGKAGKHLPYVECFPGRSRTKSARCSAVDGFPQWHFADGSIGRGKLGYERLARATGCSYP